MMEYVWPVIHGGLGGMCIFWGIIDPWFERREWRYRKQTTINITSKVMSPTIKIEDEVIEITSHGLRRGGGRIMTNEELLGKAREELLAEVRAILQLHFACTLAYQANHISMEEMVLYLDYLEERLAQKRFNNYTIAGLVGLAGGVKEGQKLVVVEADDKIVCKRAWDLFAPVFKEYFDRHKRDDYCRVRPDPMEEMRGFLADLDKRML